jgi:hypothetical protein
MFAGADAFVNVLIGVSGLGDADTCGASGKALVEKLCPIAAGASKIAKAKL